ncbi:cysteine desulfurase family protein [Metabacillus halosaccharovorans]|uniref:cysteine desulfurase family protein n=1 Tax=Metabacillus halosaccharovorans TaxID=930124 RepID=UPI00203CCDE3|nr:cysteine desulfurase family protein [Metabacillus halosaccharovorans]MCM3442016.1 cysteine desulfurase [Metabacillus halosaccharovorans]
MRRIYLDHAATSPLHPDVAEKMMNKMIENFGNPSSIHSFGREARRTLDESRRSLANTIGAKPGEIIFTSGGTEADNLAIIGTVLANNQIGKHIITTQVEHHAVLHACKYLEKQGYEVTYLPVDQQGLISLNDVKKHVTNQTVLVSVMFGNNEVGTIQPIREIGEYLKDYPAFFHTDAVQAYGMESIDVQELGVDLLTVSAHKINGPKGVGFLYVKAGIKLQPALYGGEQELKRRAGTENVAGISGFSHAAKLSIEEREQKKEQYIGFKKEMMRIFEDNNISFHLNGSLNGLPHVLNLYFPKTHIESLLVNLDLAGIAASSGSACTAGSVDPSHVLVAMYGKESDRILSSIRFSFGLGTSMDDIQYAAQEIVKVIKRITA